MKIVVIDDEIFSLNTFLSHIVDNKKLSYRMYKNDPLASLEYIKSNDVVGCFLDINMPEINGIDLAIKMIEINPRIKIVFISGYQYNEKEIKERLGDNLLGFCHKPYDENNIGKYISLIENECDPMLRVQMFPTFEAFLGEMRIEFKRTKCKELFALLVDHRGSVVTMGEAIACLWPNKQCDLAKRLYRDAVVRLRILFTSLNLENVIIFNRASLNINTNRIGCDMWDFVDNRSNNYFGEYMINYDWSIEKQSYFDLIYESRNGKKS